MRAMHVGWARRLFVGAAVTITAADAVIYLHLIAQQHGGGPAWWFVVGLCIAIVLDVYGSLGNARRHGATLVVSGTILTGLGILGILSIGAPLIVAGVLSWIAAGSKATTNAEPAPPALKPR